MKRVLGLASLILLLAAAATKAQDGSAVIRKAADDYWAFLLEERPDLRIERGLPVEHFPDPSLAHCEKNAAFGKELLSRLSGISEKQLAHEDALTLEVLREEARDLSQAPAFYWLSFPVTPYTFREFATSQVFAAHALGSKADTDHYLMLLAQYPALIRTLEAKLKEQEKRKILLARPEIPLVVGALAASGAPREQNLFWVRSERLGSLNASDRADFVSRLSAMIEDQVRPAVASLTAYLQGEYSKKAPEAVGLSQYPDGTRCYRERVRRTTSPAETPEQIHQIGLASIAKLNVALDAVRRQVAFQGSLADFRRFLKTDSRFFAKTPEEVGERLMAAQNRILPRIPEFFGRTPKAKFGVERLEPQLEGSVTFGYYQTPTPQEPAGHYKYNGSKLNERSLLFAAALIAHELVPGHHFQINLQKENETLPKFRRETYYTAFTEGWGEYASDLADQMGMYADPYDRAGRLAMDLFLTSRLVVDTGMNFYGWPREKAIAYMKENTLQSDTEIDTETLRYSCDLPAQALAYKIGMRQLVALREKARSELGPAFDIRKFHDAVLGSGSLPLDVLARHVDWFIQKAKEEGGRK
ncbi:MAG TPA: DUF885 domain-containing protein [Thermoanaerobaculia bacterium]|nr:DUF885 domain-containing protein [Thermoanaerobaculia bacterium]